MQESGEMYLETILILNQRATAPRAIDIATEMGFSKPSVSRALTRLKEEDYIIIDEGGKITLTEKGKTKAEKIYERHILLSKMLMSLGVDEKTATEDGCKMEHYMSEVTFDALKKHAERFMSRENAD